MVLPQTNRDLKLIQLLKWIQGQPQNARALKVIQLLKWIQVQPHTIRALKLIQLRKWIQVQLQRSRALKLIQLLKWIQGPPQTGRALRLIHLLKWIQGQPQTSRAVKLIHFLSGHRGLHGLVDVWGNFLVCMLSWLSFNTNPLIECSLSKHARRCQWALTPLSPTQPFHDTEWVALLSLNVLKDSRKENQISHFIITLHTLMIVPIPYHCTRSRYTIPFLIE